MDEPSDREPRTYSLLRIPVTPGERRNFVRRFNELAVFRRASDDNGMERAWLLTSVAEDDGLVVLAEWPSAVAYEGWLNNPVRVELNAELAANVSGEMTGGVFVVAHAFVREPEVA